MGLRTDALLQIADPIVQRLLDNAGRYGGCKIVNEDLPAGRRLITLQMRGSIVRASRKVFQWYSGGDLFLHLQ